MIEGRKQQGGKSSSPNNATSDGAQQYHMYRIVHANLGMRVARVCMIA